MHDLQDYIESCTTPEPELLARIARDTNLHVINPHMLSGQVQGELLRMLSRMIRPRRILELGTFTGYSALCLAEGLTDDGMLITIEHNDIGDAKTIIQRSGSFSEAAHSALQCGSFDLVFIDADKREYPEYYDLAFPLVRPGGFILADNTLWDGHITDPAYDRDKQTLGLRRFNRMVADDPRVSQVILPVRDGLTIIYKIP